MSPQKKTTAKSERSHFARQLKEQLKLPKNPGPNSWQNLFTTLAQNLPTKKTVILLDEISWMGSKDPDFLGILKDAWDFHFSSHSNLILVLCGSVSAWIEREIVNNTAFLGRTSLLIQLQELPLHELKSLWQNSHFSAYEILKILSVTGGVPRYLELLNLKETADNNIKQLCFNNTSPLLGEFERIFSDIFGERSDIYRKIISNIINNSKQQTELLQGLGRAKSGTVSQYLNDLIEAGFISRDYSWALSSGKKNKQSRYRIKDNFLRFYLKFIDPNIDRIKAGLVQEESLNNFPGWISIVGLQFENLIVNNIKSILPALEISESDVINFGPYFQTKNKQRPGCQINLLIQTKSNLLFLCEIKFSRHPVASETISQIRLKTEHLKRPKGISCLPVLIHVNGVNDQVLESNFFYRVISFGDFFN